MASAAATSRHRLAAVRRRTTTCDRNDEAEKMSNENGGERRAARQSDKPAAARLADRVARIRIRTLALVGGLVVLSVGLVVALALQRPEARDTASPTAAPVANASGSAVPGPTPASPPVSQAQTRSQFGLNAQRLLDELRSHNIPFSDADSVKLVQIGDANIARNHADIAVDDPEIRSDLRAAFPTLTEEQLADATRCTATYVVREWARLHNTTPPGERDDHGC